MQICSVLWLNKGRSDFPSRWIGFFPLWISHPSSGVWFSLTICHAFTTELLSGQTHAPASAWTILRMQYLAGADLAEWETSHPRLALIWRWIWPRRIQAWLINVTRSPRCIWDPVWAGRDDLEGQTIKLRACPPAQPNHFYSHVCSAPSSLGLGWFLQAWTHHWWQAFMKNWIELTNRLIIPRLCDVF